MTGASRSGARDRCHVRAARLRTDLAELELAELETLFAERGLPASTPRQIFRWIWKRGVTDFAAMTDLGRALRARLARDFRIATPAIARRDVSEDGTQKFVLRLQDGRQIESVFIPDTPAQTFCISTQVGCAMGCAFCLTGKMGLVRHLTAGEIAGQVRVLAHALGLLDAPFNIVLMGMGEPLHNYDATMKALRILQRPARPRGAAQARDAVHRRPGADARRLAQEAADAEPGDLAARHHRRAARGDRAADARSTGCTTSSTPAGASRWRSAAGSPSST